VRTIAESLEIPVSTIYSHLVKTIGFKIVLLCWALYMLTRKLRQKRIELSKQLFLVLESQQRVGFRDIVTGDESWFLQHSDYRQIWFISVDDIPTRVAHAIAAPKTILAVFLSIDGAILINCLTPGEKVNRDYFCKRLSEPLSEILHGGRAAEPIGPIVHFDNASSISCN
jgi:hypothetical protein